MNDKILVKLIDCKNDFMISAFWTTNWSEVLKMYSFLKENDLPYDLKINEEDNKYNDSFFKIEDIEINFGGNTGVNCILIYVEVY